MRNKKLYYQGLDMALAGKKDEKQETLVFNAAKQICNAKQIQTFEKLSGGAILKLKYGEVRVQYSTILAA